MTGIKLLKIWIAKTYPSMTNNEDYAELDYNDMQKFAEWIMCFINNNEKLKLLLNEQKIFKCKCGYETNDSFGWSIHADSCSIQDDSICCSCHQRPVLDKYFMCKECIDKYNKEKRT